MKKEKFSIHEEDDHETMSAVSSCQSLVIDENKLASLDVHHDEIKSLILQSTSSVCHQKTAVPVRETIKLKNGVTYKEAGKLGIVISGDSYYESPDRNMRLSELQLT